MGFFDQICTTDPILAKFFVVVSGLSLLPEAGLKLCSLQSHVLKAAIHLCADLPALHGKSCQHASFSAISSVAAMSVHYFDLLVCQRQKHTFIDTSKVHN